MADDQAGNWNPSMYPWQYWDGWNALLTPSPSSWAHLVAADVQATEGRFLAVPPHVGAVVRALRGYRSRFTVGLLAEWAAALQFPYYFGMNWNAFHECINDLSWLPARSYIFLVTDANRMLTETDDLATFVDILNFTAKGWADPQNVGNIHTMALPVSFHVVFHCPPAEENNTRARFRDAGVELATLLLPDAAIR